MLRVYTGSQSAMAGRVFMSTACREGHRQATMASDLAHGPWRDRLHDARDFLGAFLRRATLDGTRRGVQHRPPEASGPPPRESDLLACVNYYERSAAPCRARRPPSPSPSTSAT